MVWAAVYQFCLQFMKTSIQSSFKFRTLVTWQYKKGSLLNMSQERITESHFWILAELWCVKRACTAPWVSKSTHPRKFGNHVTVHRCPSVRTTGIPMFTLTLSNFFGSPGESWLHINVVINWQLSKQGICWPVSSGRIAGSGVDPSRSSIFWS